jgi:hypothetical protein
MQKINTSIWSLNTQNTKYVKTKKNQNLKIKSMDGYSSLELAANRFIIIVKYL